MRPLSLLDPDIGLCGRVRNFRAPEVALFLDIRSASLARSSPQRAQENEKGSLSITRAPRSFSGAEGGTRTPTGFPTTPQIREDGLRPQIRGLLHRTYRDNRHCNPE